MEKIKATCPQCGTSYIVSASIRLHTCERCNATFALSPASHEEDWYFNKWHELMGELKRADAEIILRQFHYDYPTSRKWQAARSFSNWWDIEFGAISLGCYASKDDRLVTRSEHGDYSKAYHYKSLRENYKTQMVKAGFEKSRIDSLLTYIDNLMDERIVKYNEAHKEVEPIQKKGERLTVVFWIAKIIAAIACVIAGIMCVRFDFEGSTGGIGVYLFISAPIILFESKCGANYLTAVLSRPTDLRNHVKVTEYSDGTISVRDCNSTDQFSVDCFYFVLFVISLIPALIGKIIYKMVGLKKYYSTYKDSKGEIMAFTLWEDLLDKKVEAIDLEIVNNYPIDKYMELLMGQSKAHYKLEDSEMFLQRIRHEFAA